MPATVTSLNEQPVRKSILGRVVSAYPDGRGLLIQFDTPVRDGAGRIRKVGYASAGVGSSKGMPEGLTKFKMGSRVVVTAELSKSGLATITSIRSR